jgi:hypothetical protein
VGNPAAQQIKKSTIVKKYLGTGNCILTAHIFLLPRLSGSGFNVPDWKRNFTLKRGIKIG